MKLEKGFGDKIDILLVDMDEAAKDKAKAGIEKAVKATIKKKLKKKRRAFVRRVIVIGAVAAVGYYVYTKSDKVKAAVNDAKDKVVDKVPTDKIPFLKGKCEK